MDICQCKSFVVPENEHGFVCAFVCVCGMEYVLNEIKSESIMRDYPLKSD